MSASRGLAPPSYGLAASAASAGARTGLPSSPMPGGPHRAYPGIPCSHLPPTSPNTPLPTSPSFTPEPTFLPPFHSPPFLPFSPAKVRPWCSWPIRRSGAARSPPHRGPPCPRRSGMARPARLAQLGARSAWRAASPTQTCNAPDAVWLVAQLLAQPLALLRDVFPCGAFTEPRALGSPKRALTACTCILVRVARRQVSVDIHLPLDDPPSTPLNDPIYPLRVHSHAIASITCSHVVRARRACCRSVSSRAISRTSSSRVAHFVARQ